MSTITQHDANASPNSPRRITPSAPPQFPCEVQFEGSDTWHPATRRYWDCLAEIDRPIYWRPIPYGPKPEQVVGGEPKLRMEYINSLPQPFIAHFFGGDEWPVNDIEVGTGLLRIDVVGKLQVKTIGEVNYFIDANGIKHDSDTFYTDYVSESPPPAAPTDLSSNPHDHGMIPTGEAAPGMGKWGAPINHLEATRLRATSSPAAPQSVREAIQKIIEDKVDSQNTLLLHPWALAERIVKAFPPTDLHASADRLHAAIAVMLKDWKDGDFALPELARIHMENVREEYQEVGKALRAPFPSPVAQQDWAKEVRGAAKEFFANVDGLHVRVTPTSIDTAHLKHATIIGSFEETLTTIILKHLRHAPAATGGVTLTNVTDFSWAVGSIEGVLKGIRTTEALLPNQVEAIDSALEQVEALKCLDPLKFTSPAPHLKETGGDSARLDWLENHCLSLVLAGKNELDDRTIDVNATPIREAIDAAMLARPTPAKDEPKEL